MKGNKPGVAANLAGSTSGAIAAKFSLLDKPRVAAKLASSISRAIAAKLADTFDLVTFRKTN
ncbi:MAG TPA: hypothetical protein VL921_02485 [Candidatus Udaeobacter sp.]|nr:hypothetical protein [Candidatus Udaeobacter sp.]